MVYSHTSVWSDDLRRLFAVTLFPEIPTNVCPCESQSRPQSPLELLDGESVGTRTQSPLFLLPRLGFKRIANGKSEHITCGMYGDGLCFLSQFFCLKQPLVPLEDYFERERTTSSLNRLFIISMTKFKEEIETKRLKF